MHEDIALSILVLAECAHFYSAFNPSIFTIRRFPDENTKRDITVGCVLASAFGLVLAGATAYIAKSKSPLIFGIISIVAMNAIYLYVAYGVNGKNPINKETTS